MIRCSVCNSNDLKFLGVLIDQPKGWELEGIVRYYKCNNCGHTHKTPKCSWGWVDQTE